MERSGASDKRSRRRLPAAIMCGMLCTVLFSGCVYMHTVPSGLEPQARTPEPGAFTVIGESESQSSSFNLLWVLPVTPRIDYDVTVNRAIARLNGDDLIEVRTWIERQIWILGMVEILHVKGKVIRYEK
jgi:hypothetical protein